MPTPSSILGMPPSKLRDAGNVISKTTGLRESRACHGEDDAERQRHKCKKPFDQLVPEYNKLRQQAITSELPITSQGGQAGSSDGLNWESTHRSIVTHTDTPSWSRQRIYCQSVRIYFKAQRPIIIYGQCKRLFFIIRGTGITVCY